VKGVQAISEVIILAAPVTTAACANQLTAVAISV
jgi:hypothetical protein